MIGVRKFMDWGLRDANGTDCWGWVWTDRRRAGAELDNGRCDGPAGRGRRSPSRLGERADFSARSDLPALGSDEAGYRVRARGDGLLAVNAGQGLHASFGRGGAVISTRGATVGFRLTGVGDGESLTRLSAVTPTAISNRVRYSRPGVEEWYANGPLGIEQGFTVPRPLTRGAGPLTLSLALSGNLRATLAAEGQALDLSRAGQTTLTYQNLTATDAFGRSLKARLALTGDELSIRVDTKGARYPVRIDPLVKQAELTGPARSPARPSAPPSPRPATARRSPSGRPAAHR